ncbi:MAG: DsbA family protein [Zetaproteobacteria bacterium CG1_02_53_45]|nr:MAG: DsbA family protein [Zetaproteobacteria bacterium CG1_02_53_45]
MAVLWYIHDPMCSWCWAFRPVWAELRSQLPDAVEVNCLLGGLAPDSDAPMSIDTQAMIRHHWQTIETRVPGTCFNDDFWTRCAPRRSTYPACRAVIAATRQNPALEDAMILSIQQAYYLQARNPSDDEVLIELATNLSLDPDRFRTDLNSAQTRAELLSEIHTSRNMGVTGFPALVLETNGVYRHIRIDYKNAAVMLQQLTAGQGL